MNKLALKAIFESKKPLMFTGLGITISIILLIFTFKTTFYLTFLSLPITTISVILFVLTSKQLVSSYKTLSAKEENLPDGIYNKYYDGGNNIKQTFKLMNGNREGLSKGYYENGQLEFTLNYKNGYPDGESISYNQLGIVIREAQYLNGKYQNKYIEYFDNGQLKLILNYKNGLQDGDSVLYNQFGIVVRKAQYLNGKYLNECIEYFDNGSIRMVQDNSKYLFYDENSVLRCEINIDSSTVTIDEYRKGRSCWYKWHWNEDSSYFGNDIRYLYIPKGIWKNYNNNGNLDFEFIFDTHKSNEKVRRIFYDPSGKVSHTDFIIVKELIIENFVSAFSYERLIEKKARYKTVHFNPGGWQYKEFNISPVLGIDDILNIETAE